MDGIVALKGMEFHSYHGVYEFERQKGNIFHIDIAFELDLEKPAKSDNIADTLDYVEVYQEIAAVMKNPVNLLEHLAYLIINKMLDRFPQAKRVEVSISKDAPPVGGICKESVVTLSRNREI